LFGDYRLSDFDCSTASGDVMKVKNEYSRQLKDYDRIPKAVLAAIAVSFATQGGDFLDEANERIFEEWQILYQSGIVSQKPFK